MGHKKAPISNKTIFHGSHTSQRGTVLPVWDLLAPFALIWLSRGGSVVSSCSLITTEGISQVHLDIQKSRCTFSWIEAGLLSL